MMRSASPSFCVRSTTPSSLYPCTLPLSTTPPGRAATIMIGDTSLPPGAFPLYGDSSPATVEFDWRAPVFGGGPGAPRRIFRYLRMLTDRSRLPGARTAARYVRIVPAASRLGPCSWEIRRLFVGEFPPKREFATIT